MNNAIFLLICAATVTAEGNSILIPGGFIAAAGVLTIISNIMEV